MTLCAVPRALALCSVFRERSLQSSPTVYSLHAVCFLRRQRLAEEDDPLVRLSGGADPSEQSDVTVARALKYGDRLTGRRRGHHRRPRQSRRASKYGDRLTTGASRMPASTTWNTASNRPMRPLPSVKGCKPPTTTTYVSRTRPFCQSSLGMPATRIACNSRAMRMQTGSVFKPAHADGQRLKPAHAVGSGLH